MDMSLLSLGSQIAIGAQSSIWMKDLIFQRAETTDPLLATSALKSKYQLLRGPGPPANGFSKPLINAKMVNKCNGEKGIAVSSGQKEMMKEEIPDPKIRIESPDIVRLNWRKANAIGAGLTNLGNTCFMNSVLQCLTYCPPLVNFLVYGDGEHSKSQCSNFCMACLLARHMRRCFQSSGSVVKPIEIAQRLKSVAKHFQLGRQEDAHEYLRHLIDCMCRHSVLAYENRHPPLKLDPASKETTAFNHIFGGHLRSQVTCLECKNRSNTYDHFLDLMLDIKNVLTLEKALEKFTKPEDLQHDNAYRCPKCKKRSHATKRFSVQRPPNVATIQLKRFEFSRFAGKITKHITFSEHLDLRPYMSENSGSCLKYRLHAVLVHTGNTCHSGHYFCYVRNSNGTWFRMDDERVHTVPLQQVLNQIAYILFYVRVDTSTHTANGSLAPLKTAATRTPTPVPSPTKFTPISKSGSLFLPRPFSVPDGEKKVPLAATAPVSGAASLPKGPKLICEPIIRKAAANGTTSTAASVGVVHSKAQKHASRNLVPYSSDSSDDETAAQQKRVQNGHLSKQKNIGDNNDESVIPDRKPLMINGTCASSSDQNGTLTNGFAPKHPHTVSTELKRLEGQSLQSLGSSVTDWSGNKNQIDDILDREKRTNGLDDDELYNQEYDRGKVKKVRVEKTEKSAVPNGSNAFDLFRNNGLKKDSSGRSSFAERYLNARRRGGRGQRTYSGRGGHSHYAKVRYHRPHQYR